MYLTCNAAMYTFLTLVNTVRFTIQGLGYSLLAILAGVFEMIARGTVGYFLVPRFGYIAACFASPAAWFLADVFLVISYLLIMRHLKRIIIVPESA